MNVSSFTVKNTFFIADRSLIFDGLILDDAKNEFNDLYTKFCDLNSNEDRDIDGEYDRIKYGVGAALVVLNKLDFDDLDVMLRAEDYKEFARKMLINACVKPNYNPEWMIIVISFYYGDTRIGLENTIENIRIGNEWVSYLERNTDVNPIKGYALTLRAYRYISRWKDLELDYDDIVGVVKNELEYAILWDNKNYMALFAMGLLLSDSNSRLYDLDSAREYFAKVCALENDNECFLDKYVVSGAKENFIKSAKEKLQ